MAAAGNESPWMNDELRMFRATVRQFIQKEFLPHQARWREQQRPDAEAWTQAGATGLLLPDLPEAYGGGGGDFAHAAVEIGRASGRERGGSTAGSCDLITQEANQPGS